MIRLRGGKEQIQITHWHFRVTQSSSDVWHLQKKLCLFRPANFLAKVLLTYFLPVKLKLVSIWDPTMQEN